MTGRDALREAPWERVRDALPGKAGDAGGSAADNRQCIDAVMWIACNGTRWRALPAEYGHWNSVSRRFRRGARKGGGQMICNPRAVDADTAWLMRDATIVRAHQHAAGASKKRGAGGRQTRRSTAAVAVFPPKSRPSVRRWAPPGVYPHGGPGRGWHGGAHPAGGLQSRCRAGG